jgi:hypothetical protein
METLVVVIKYGAAFLSGGLAVKIFEWWSDKDKAEKERRRLHVAEWRKWLSTLPDIGGWSGEGEEERKILRSAEFQSLEPHLDKELTDRLRKHRTVLVGFDINRTLSKRIGELEKAWKLT